MSDAMRPLHFGQLALPEGWELRAEVSCLEPRRALSMPLAGRRDAGAPRANLVVSRRAAERSAEKARRKLLEQLKKELPRLEVVDEGRDIAHDGEGLARLTVAFGTPDGLQVVQRHWFRVDREVLTQLTATTDHGGREKLDGALYDLALSYTPPR